MSTVKLKVDGLKEREVQNVTYTLQQQTDAEGQPAGIVRGGKITLKVKSTNDGNIEFLEWMCDSYLAKNGTIEFLKMDGTNMKTLKFEHAYLVNYTEVYDAINSNNQAEEFIISAKKITMGNAAHNNKWTMDS